MLGRFTRYARKCWNFSEMVAHVRDGRPRSQIPSASIFLCVFGMFALRLLSFNELQQRMQKSKGWSAWIGRPIPSVDTLGYALEPFDGERLRDCLSWVARQAKRKKALRRLSPERYPQWVAAIDGHELWSSEKRSCDQCLTRVVETTQGPVTQYYHRVVVLQLVDVSPPLILDIEPILPGEEEVAPALRMLKRLRQRYPRFLDVITVDAWYLGAPFVKAVQEEGLDVVIVLKQENRDLYQDVDGLLKITPPLPTSPQGVQWWDFEGLTSWTQLGKPVRVVRSLEPKTKRVRVARRWEKQTIPSDWRWMTSLAKSQAPTEWIHRWGHVRWDIENRGFNELVQHWAMNHCFHHEPNTIIAILLIMALAFSLTTFFFDRNLKPAVRKGKTRLFLAHLLADDLIRSPFESFWAHPP